MTPAQIARMRARHGLTQEQLGSYLGHAKDGGRQVRRWEAGAVKPFRPAVAALVYLDAILSLIAAKHLRGLHRAVLVQTLKEMSR